MKRAIRFLARLYPAPWRAKYGDEFEALLNDSTPNTGAALDVLKGALTMQMTSGNFANTLVTGAVAGAILAIAISFAVPRMYRSQGIIAVTSARRPYALDQIFALEQQVLSRQALGSIIQEKRLYPAENARMPMDDVINVMRRNIAVRPSRAPSSADPSLTEITIEFRYPDPVVAQQVTIALLTSFIEFNMRSVSTSSSNDPSLLARLRVEMNGPPTLPRQPTGPNRIWIATIGLLVGLLAAVVLSLVTRRRSAQQSLST